jgi:hypothetical protein
MTLMERIAHHEAGHAVACIVYSIPIIDVRIDTEMPALHRADYRAPVGVDSIETMSVCCMSGPSAEELFCGSCSDYGDVIEARKITL